MTTIDMTGASDAEFEARIAPFEDEWSAPESLLERVAQAICPGDYCESHDECRIDAESAIAVMRPGAP